MPYKSSRQRRFMYARHPEVAEKWEREGKNYVSKTYKHHKYKKGDKK